ncbi:hypothetical protein C8R46DRAFT_1033004 [Mycena filopes]|nr:hypothetical protein C8R46DRAFT_1033004 [Mycena filopes]
MPHPQYTNALGRRPSVPKDINHEELAKFNKYFGTDIDLSPLPEPSHPAQRPHTPLRPSTPAGQWRVPAPSPEPPLLPSDWWHSATNIRLINGPGALWAGDHIPFVPNHGRCPTGVSMKLARLGAGMFHGGALVSRFIHPMLFCIPEPMLSIQWPGYYALPTQPLRIEQPLDLSERTTLAQLGQQVAEYVFEFSTLYQHYCDSRDPSALLLGVGGIDFNRLRLVKLWTSNRGLSWNAEIGVVDDYVKY